MQVIQLTKKTRDPETYDSGLATSHLDEAIDHGLWHLARDWEHVLDLRRWHRHRHQGMNDGLDRRMSVCRYPSFDHPDSIFWSQLLSSQSHLERLQLLGSSFRAEVQFLEAKAALQGLF